MFNKHEGLTAKDWNRAFQAATKGREAADDRLMGSTHKIQALKNQLGTAKRKIENLEAGIRTLKEEIRTAREEVTELKQSTFFYCGRTAKDWNEEYAKLDQEYQEKKEQFADCEEKLEAQAGFAYYYDGMTAEQWYNAYDKASIRSSNREKENAELRNKIEEIGNLRAQFEKEQRLRVIAVKESDRLYEVIREKNTSIQDLESDIQLKKRKYGAKCLEVVDLEYSLKTGYLHGRNIHEWEQECEKLKKQRWKDGLKYEWLEPKTTAHSFELTPGSCKCKTCKQDLGVASEHCPGPKQPHTHVFGRPNVPGGPGGAACKCGITFKDWKNLTKQP